MEPSALLSVKDGVAHLRDNLGRRFARFSRSGKGHFV